MTPRTFAVVRPLMLALLLVCWLHAIRASAALPESSPGAAPSLLPFSSPVLSDFDRDHKPDQASLSWEGSVKTIHIHFGNSSWTSLSFDSGVSEPGRLVSEDINNDGYADLIWFSQIHPRKFTAWIGDGDGHFFQGRDSQIDFRRIQGLLQAAKFEPVHQSWQNEMPGALLGGGHPVLPALARRWTRELAGAFLWPAQLPEQRPLFLNVPRKRGPPSLR